MPTAIATILEKVTEMSEMMQSQSQSSDDTVYLTIEQLREYHPDKPSDSTVRRWIRKGFIPYYKDANTRRIKFKKSEIDDWIERSRRLSKKERDAIFDEQPRSRRYGSLDDPDID